MKIKVFQPSQLALGVATSIALGALAGTANAVVFQFNDGEINGRFDTQISAGALFRTESSSTVLRANQDPVYMAGLGYSTQLNKNDANNNYDVGMASMVYKITPEMALDFGGNWGIFARATSFYDSVIMGGGHDGGALNPAAVSPAFGINRYATDSDFANNGAGDRFTRDTKRYAGKRTRLLDAYVWTNFDLLDRPATLRVGQQVITWGEALFIQNGINTANYIDLAALRRPGSELKEALLPLDSVVFNYGLTDSLSMEAFYQFEWKNSEDSPVGTYYSTHDAFPGDGADNVIVDGRLLADKVNVPALADAFANYTFNTYGLSGEDGPYEYEQTQVTVNRLRDKEAKNDDQFGLGFRYFADQLNGTEFGVFYSRLHQRLPVVGARLDLVGGGTIPEKVDSARYFMAYPEAIDMYGFSFNTTVGMISLAGEVAYRPKQTIINEVGDNLIQSLAGLAAEAAPTIADMTGHCVRAKLGGDCLASTDAVVQGQEYYFYDEAETVTASLLSIASFGPSLGTDNLIAIVELGLDSTHGLNDNLRYNSTAAIQDDEAKIHDPSDPNSFYLTENAWGYRAIVRADYNDFFAGIVMQPSIRLAHDVKGNSPIGGNFMEDRKAATLGVDFTYLNNLKVGVEATTFWGADYSNKLADRNNASVALSYSF